MNQPIRNETRLIAIGICLLVLGVMPLVLSAVGQGPGTHSFFLTESNLFDGRWLLEKKDKIALTRAQEEKIENLMLAHEAFSIRCTAEIKIKELQFAAYLKTGKIDRKEIEKHIREIGKEKTNLIVDHLNYLLDLRNLLTNRQIETLMQIKEQKKPEIHRNDETPKSKKNRSVNRG